MFTIDCSQLASKNNHQLYILTQVPLVKTKLANPEFNEFWQKRLQAMRMNANDDRSPCYQVLKGTTNPSAFEQWLAIQYFNSGISSLPTMTHVFTEGLSAEQLSQLQKSMISNTFFPPFLLVVFHARAQLAKAANEERPVLWAQHEATISKLLTNVKIQQGSVGYWLQALWCDLVLQQHSNTPFLAEEQATDCLRALHDNLTLANTHQDRSQVAIANAFCGCNTMDDVFNEAHGKFHIDKRGCHSLSQLITTLSEQISSQQQSTINYHC